MKTSPKPIITKITLKHGSEEKKDSLEFDPGHLTVFVGPNNSGKSLALREIYACCQNGVNLRIVNSVDVRKFETFEEFEQFVMQGSVERDSYLQYYVQEMNSVSNVSWTTQTLGKKDILGISYTEQRNVRSLLSRLFCILMNGKVRLSLVDNQELSDLQHAPKNHIMALFRNTEKRLRMRQYLYDAFGSYFVIDPTNIGRVRVRFSERQPLDEEEEQALSARAIEFHRNATDISEMSDGVKAFTGLLAALLSTTFRLMLIDEPEAFLHPPLAKKLGQYVSELSSSQGANVFISTHSADFLMGCIESGVSVNVVRLTYKDKVSTAKILPAQKISEFMKDPLMRSTKVLDALFHSGVVVTESDSDRSFYQEVNHRLLANRNDSENGLIGMRDTLFINAQNKQTIKRIVGPLRQAGIPAAAIVDIDYLKDGGKQFTDLLEAAQIPQMIRQSLTGLRTNLKNSFDATGKDMKRHGGKNLLAPVDGESFDHFVAQLAAYGVFVVPHGELESWLPELGASGHGPDWLINIFEQMRADPSDPLYVWPKNNDVWKFVSAVAQWIHNPMRHGVT